MNTALTDPRNDLEDILFGDYIVVAEVNRDAGTTTLVRVCGYAWDNSIGGDDAGKECTLEDLAREGMELPTSESIAHKLWQQDEAQRVREFDDN